MTPEAKSDYVVVTGFTSLAKELLQIFPAPQFPP